MKILRRLIIVVCAIIILIRVISNFPINDYGFGVTQKEIDEITVTQIIANKKSNIDDRTITVEKINIDKDKDIHVQYKSERFPSYWSFCGEAIHLYDDKGNEYKSRGSYGSNGMWTQNELVSYKGPLKDEAEQLIFKYDRYNRYMEITVPIRGEGEQTE